MKILDIGCGTINNKHWIYNSIHQTIGIDIEISNIETCQKKFPDKTFLLVNGISLPFENGYFDMLHSLDVLEHVDDLKIVLTEATRVLRQWGEFIIEVPYWKSEERLLSINNRYWDVLHHVRMFRDNELEKVMSKYGFQLTESYGLKFFENITLWYSLRRGDLLNQRGETEITPPLLLNLLNYFFIKEAALFSIKSKILIYPFYIILSPIRWLGNAIFPKSIYFKFRKIV